MPKISIVLVILLSFGCSENSSSGDPDAESDTSTDPGPDTPTDTYTDPDVDSDPVIREGCTEGRFWVTPEGDDDGPGTMEQPFGTLEAARDAVRSLAEWPDGGVTVVLRGGVYERSRTLELTTADSGQEGAPLVWCGYDGELPRIIGGLVIDPGRIVAVTDADELWSRLEPAARDQIVRVDLSSLVPDLGTLENRATSGWAGGENRSLEPYFDGSPMELARWPDRVETDDFDWDIDSIEIVGTGTSPDPSGIYEPAGEHNGRTYFAHQSDTWFIHYNTNGHYYLSNATTFGGPGTAAWWSDGGPTPFGPYNPDSSAVSGNPRGIREADDGFARISLAIDTTTFVYEGDRPSRWEEATDIYAMGYWEHTWHASHESVVDIDTSSRTIVVTENPYSMADRQPYFVYNLPEEITVPGEWWLDRSSSVLYLWPPRAEGELVVSVMQAPLVEITDASHVGWRAVTFEASRGDLLVIDGGSDNVIEGCELKNAGSTGVRISGRRNGISGSSVHHTGASGVRLWGGDRATLQRGDNTVTNCEIHHWGRTFWTYHHGVDMVDPSGNQADCGNSVAHNLIHHGPHAAVLFRGNEHLIELNEIHDACQWASDMGAIYTGRDWGFHGNTIRHNFIHHIRSPLGVAQHAVYLDDCASGIHVFGNVIYEGSPSSAILHGGGRDNTIENNIVVGSAFFIHIDNRGRSAIGNDGGSWDLLEKLRDMNYTVDPWATAYPSVAAIPDDWSTLEDSSWLDPEGCVFTRNVGFRNDGFLKQNNYSGITASEVYSVFADYLEDEDPLFADESALDLSLLPTSPAHDIPGWVQIPFDEIGIQD